MKKISIIIPSLESIDTIRSLLDALENQVFSDFEVIFVDSQGPSSSAILEQINESKSLDIKYFSVKPMLPGAARNYGVKKAQSSLIIFLDTKTIPSEFWLESSLRKIELEKNDVVFGKFYTAAESRFQELVKAATFGNQSIDCLPGTMLHKSTFEEVGDFLEHIRAGEDLEWLKRVKLSNFRVGTLEEPSIKYVGLPKNFITLIYKWFLYSKETAYVEVILGQKALYFSISLIGAMYLILNWNYLFTNDLWDSSPYFVPHINKIVWSLTFIIYFLFRSLYLPSTKNVPNKYLFPINWFFVGILGLAIDISKMPGRVLGYLLYLKEKIKF